MSVSLNADTEKARSYLETLCRMNPGRQTGSSGNRVATDFFASAIGSWGYDVDTTPFPCMDFESYGASLICDGHSYAVFPSPFTTSCDVTARLISVATMAELQKCRCKGKILLMKGELCAEHLMPRNYPFYNPEHHQKIIALLDKKQPAAIVTATGKNPALMGALYPYPLFDDGDFDIPSVYCTDATGEEIAARAGSEFSLAIDARRIPSTACNVLARKNPGARKKIVVCAHIDARPTTPGALDNASGVVTLMLLAEMLRDYRGKTGIELVAISGEEHYSAAGELDYLDRYGSELDRVVLAVNIDGTGYVKGKTAFSLYGLPKTIERYAREALGGCDTITEGEQWYAGDHMIFVQGGRPAIALTSDRAAELTAEIIHTSRDTPDLVDCRKLVDAAAALKTLIEAR
ncbi:MAG: alkaline phosphatase isozyme conversion aminopeptidase [Methanocella sp. PtaU1.Bin125]|nr:MAG: alkaline phosphatase isozyme conversion aminopeptidase [Methanocella sp. PtaU1.Bin125]